MKSNVFIHSVVKKLNTQVKKMNDFSTMNCFPNHVPTDPYHLIDYIFRTVLPSKGYAVREDQIRLCKTMYVGLTAKHVSICEAEVGTGKTMAYLVAAIVAKRMLERKGTDCLTVTIATSSIELQKSILEKEIPLLSTLLQHYGICSRPLTAVLRKGKEHYICRMRFEDFLSNIRRFPKKYEKIINYFSSDGFIERVLDLDKLKIPPAIKSKISASMSCFKCKYSDNCRYRTFVRNATRSINLDFQVANHNFYLAALRHYKEDGAMLLHPGSLVIIDEAHKLKEAAETAFGESLSQKDIPTYLNAIKYNGDQSRSYSQLIEKTYSMNQLLFDRIKGLLDSNDDNRLLALSSTELSIITQLIHYINTIESRQRMNLRHPYANINRLLTTLTTICKRTSINIWAETNANGMITLGCSPQNINLVMEQNVWDQHSHYVLTSGTMSDGNNFNYFMHENGLDRINHHYINQSRTASPFDYYNHTRLYIPDDMPFPDNNSSEYIHSIANQILQLIEATNGHTAILFTSYKVLYT